MLRSVADCSGSRYGSAKDRRFKAVLFPIRPTVGVLSDCGPQFHTRPPLPSVGGRADRPIFHLVLNWARNPYPYFANTEREEGPASPWLGAAMGEEAAMRGGNFGIGSRTNCNCANHASPSVRRPSVPSVLPTVHRISPLGSLSPLSPFAIHPLPIAKTTAACANSAGLSSAGRCGGDTYPASLCQLN